MADDYGVDVSTYPGGLDPTGRSIGGVRVLAEQLARLVETEEGLLDYEPEQRTLDLIDYLSLDLDDDGIRQLEADIEAIWTSDERVAAASVTVTLSGETMSVEGFVTTFTGKTFSLVLNVTSAGVMLARVTLT